MQIAGRLCACAELVRQGAVLADIGTDHAYLPIFLLKEGIISRAYATDVNKGPLASAEENIRESGFSDSVTLMLCDGAAALADTDATDYAICGMGGELIAEIIDAAPHLKNTSIRLILQPMSKQPELRRFLYKNGFTILKECYSRDTGKLYVCFLAEFTGEEREIGTLESILPVCGCEVVDKSAERDYLTARLESYRRAAKGKISGGEDNPEELGFIDAITEYLSGRQGQHLLRK
jgi:tRNA (adenine22-N1)-methyltransferase